MEKFTQKWALINLLEPINEGEEFFRTDFPLHVTLAGVFAIDLNSLELFNLLSSLLVNQQPVESMAEKEACWGNNGEIIVVQLRKSRQIMALHRKIISSLTNAGAVFNEPQYEGEGYIPHSTVQKRNKLNIGDLVKINDVTIVDLFPGGDGQQRKILKTIKLFK